MSDEFHQITIEPKHDEWGDAWNVYGHGFYEDSSVLAGTPRRVFLNSFPTASLCWVWAESHYPGMDITQIEGSSKIEIKMSDTPPDWFDPLDAGEEW